MRGVKRFENPLVWIYALALVASMFCWPFMGRWVYWLFVALAAPFIISVTKDLLKDQEDRSTELLMVLVCLAMIAVGFNARSTSASSSDRSPQLSERLDR